MENQVPYEAATFFWQVFLGCLPVRTNFKTRGIKCYIPSERCGQTEEAGNHVLFECPPTIQRITNLLGFFGIFGNNIMKRFLLVLTKILQILYNWQRQKPYYGWSLN
ncbi:hypothetical protein IGI04_002646 [Brassica rapa subsp. trilocularis]|uniref:Reverse transcriptase zinc-binding domain-containing protein n=1 Tax=Brassica rapa subsp. trilocularis TaxID=1813537 RepID=A0ABQ7NZF9_BRACM|nr:hypothetical protein IGI04_002646 [Brassica rapa subsp. trilocularis]